MVTASYNTVVKMKPERKFSGKYRLYIPNIEFLAPEFKSGFTILRIIGEFSDNSPVIILPDKYYNEKNVYHGAYIKNPEIGWYTIETNGEKRKNLYVYIPKLISWQYKTDGNLVVIKGKGEETEKEWGRTIFLYNSEGVRYRNSIIIKDNEGNRWDEYLFIVCNDDFVITWDYIHGTY